MDTPAVKRSRIFVGDVQGCADELEDLLDALAYDASRHALWFVGDLVNRGPHSARVLRRVRELGAGSVLGNHDLRLLAVGAGLRRLRARDTFGDVLEAEDRDALLDWLRRRPLLQLWDDVLLVHAGLHPRWQDPRRVAAPLEAAIRRGELPLGDADLAFLTSVRTCNALGERPVDDLAPVPGFVPWDHFYCGSRTVVCGHWSARGLVRGERLRSIDTGCVWGGQLTAWIAQQDRCVSVPARRAYQPIG